MIPETILVVAGAASFSTRDVWEGYRRGLAALGYDVVPYPTFSVLKILSHELTGNDLVGKALDVRHRVNVAVFVDGLYFQGERAWVPATLRNQGVLTVLVKTDDPYSPIPQADEFFDIVVSNELAELKHGEIYVPTATELPPPDFTSIAEPSIDLCFIGTLFEDRVPLIQQLVNYCERERIRFSVMGNIPHELQASQSFQYVTVSRRTVSVDKKWRTYAKSRAVLNLFRESDVAVSPNPRVFEVTALGGPALLTGPRRTEVTSIFGDSVFHYNDLDELVSQLQLALNDEAGRVQRVHTARQITRDAHLYRHRCETVVTHIRHHLASRCDRVSVNSPGKNITSEIQPAEANLDRRLAWIIGCGRTGSTWLCEMLSDVPAAIAWHEPYFGRFFKHVFDDPRERNRETSFFADVDRGVLYASLRRLFFDVAERRYQWAGSKSLFVKEVNTPEFFGTIGDCFPGSAIILLQRDPFDVFDSYLAMMQPGSWNRRAARDWAQGPTQAARHIVKCFTVAAEAYKSAPAERRLLLRYEELLNEPANGIVRCLELTGQTIDNSTATEIAGRHQFANQSVTGALAFHRFGKAGSWQTSGQFTSEIQQIANRELAELRAAMGYTAARV